MPGPSPRPAGAGEYAIVDSETVGNAFVHLTGMVVAGARPDPFGSGLSCVVVV